MIYTESGDAKGKENPSGKSQSSEWSSLLSELMEPR